MDRKGGWKRFQKLRFDPKVISRRARRAETATTRHAHKFVLGRLKNLREAREYIASWLLVVAILISAVALQTFWSQESYSQSAAVPGGTYAEGMLGPIATLNPLYAQSDAELSAVRLIFSSLYDYDSTGHLRGDIATSLTSNREKTSYTVTIRPDAKWHDGQKVTADDVVFTINLMKNLDAHALMYNSWSGVSAVATNPTTAQFTLQSPYALFPQALTFAILPKHILQKVAPGALSQSTFSISPVGSGPFQLRLLQSTGNDTLHKIVNLARWDNYHHGKAKLERFEIHSYVNATEIVQALKRRDINAAFDINDVSGDLSKSALQTDSYSTGGGVYALFNTQQTVLSDQSVRVALQRGADTTKIRQSLSFKPPKLDLPFLSNQVQGVTLPDALAYDKQAAQQSLDKAGWGKGRDGIRYKGNARLIIHVAYLKNPEYSHVAKMLADQWRQLGIDVQLNEFNPATSADQTFAQSVLQPRRYDVLINQLSIGADPDVFPYWHSSQANPFGLNFSNYTNPSADDALLSARLRDEPELRAKKYAAFATQWLQDVPAIGLYQSTVVYAHTTSTTAITPHTILPTIVDRYSNILYWTTNHAQVYKTP